MKVPGYVDINFVKWYHTIDPVEDTGAISYQIKRITKEAYRYLNGNSYYTGRLELYKIDDFEYWLSIIQLTQLSVLWKAAHFTQIFSGSIQNIKDEIDDNLERLLKLGIFI